LRALYRMPSMNLALPREIPLCIGFLSLYRLLYDSLRAWFSVLFTRRFSAFTRFIRVFSLGDQHGTYLAFGRNVDKLV